MSRKTTIINSWIEPETNVNVELLTSPGTWTVYYKGHPFNLRRTTPGSVPIYSKVAFPAIGHAIALCRRLNELSKTNDFKVIHLRSIDEV